MRILDAAARILAEQGYTGARLEDIAQAADTKAGSLYYYFGSRDELVQEVLNIAVTRVTKAVKKRVRALPDEATYRDRIGAALETNLTMALEHDSYTAASLRIATNLPPSLRRRQLATQRDYGNFFCKLLQGAQAAGEIDPKFDLSVLRMLLLGSVNWSVEWYKAGGVSSAGIAAQLTDMFFDGLSPVTADESVS